MLVGLALLFACSPEEGPTLAPDTLWDTPTDPSPLDATTCRADPPLTGEAVSLRADGAGGLWHLGIDGRVTRYAVGTGDGCVLEGTVVLGDGELEAVQDLELDDAGRPYALVYFDTVARLDPSGAVTLSCAAESGHALAPSPDGGAVYVWSVGAEGLDVVQMGEACSAGAAVPLDQPIGTSGAVGPDGFGAASFDPGGELPPGFVFDLADGAAVLDLAPGGAVTTIGDVVPAGDGWLVTDPVDRGLFRLAADGSKADRYDPDALPGGEDRYLGFSSVAYVPGGSSYVAASDLDGAGIWRVEGL